MRNQVFTWHAESAVAPYKWRTASKGLDSISYFILLIETVVGVASMGAEVGVGRCRRGRGGVRWGGAGRRGAMEFRGGDG